MRIVLFKFWQIKWNYFCKCYLWKFIWWFSKNLDRQIQVWLKCLSKALNMNPFDSFWCYILSYTLHFMFILSGFIIPFVLNYNPCQKLWQKRLFCFVNASKCPPSPNIKVVLVCAKCAYFRNIDKGGKGVLSLFL